MKKILSIAALALCTATAFGQTSESTEKIKSPDGKNLIKVNVTSLFLNNYSFQYERAVGKKISAGLGFRFMPKSGMPLKSTIEKLIDDEETVKQLETFKTSNFALTPEVRFYLGKSVYRGFYVAPYARIANFKADLPSFSYTFEGTANGQTVTQTETIPLSGNLNTVTGGLMLGAQWKLSRLLYLDWWIIGAQYGTANGNIKGSKTLSNEEQQALREELEDLDIPNIDTEVTVDASGAKVDMKGPWAGLRGGLAIGVRF